MDNSHHPTKYGLATIKARDSLPLIFFRHSKRDSKRRSGRCELDCNKAVVVDVAAESLLEWVAVGTWRQIHNLDSKHWAVNRPKTEKANLDLERHCCL